MALNYVATITTDARHHLLAPDNGGVHTTVRFEFPTLSDRDAFTNELNGVTGTPEDSDLGSVCRVGIALFMLTGVSPIVWSPFNVTLSATLPSDLGSAAVGVSGEVARADHVHAHGNQAGGALHADATSGASGFLSALDKVKLDGIESGATSDQTAADVPFTPSGDLTASDVQGALVELRDDTDGKLTGKADVVRSLVAGAGLVGGGTLSSDLTFSVGAPSDGSILVNADDIQVGVLASDAQHGARGGGSQHAVATTSVAGFLSASDKTKLDGVEVGAEVNPTSLAELNTLIGATLDEASAPRTPTAHAASHLDGGTDELAGDDLTVSYAASFYTGGPTLASHLAGIDEAFENASAGVWWVAQAAAPGGDGSRGAPFRTFTEALAVANPAAGPTSIQLVLCLDSGVYDEAISLVSHVYVYAPNAALEYRTPAVALGAVVLEASCGVHFRRVLAAAGGSLGDAVYLLDAGTSGPVFVEARELLVEGLGSACLYDNGPSLSRPVFVRTDAVRHTGGAGSLLERTTVSSPLYWTFREAELRDSGTGFSSNSATPNNIYLCGDRLFLSSAGSGVATGVSCGGGGSSVSLGIREISFLGKTAISATAGQVSGFVQKIAGAVTGTTDVRTLADFVDLTDALPAALGTTAAGVSVEASRADHVHAHGDQLGGTLHAGATTSVAGFLSAADKTKLDGVEAGAQVNPASLSALNTAIGVTLDVAGDPRTPTSHAASHQHGGADEVATATPSANAIPKADASGQLSDGWIPVGVLRNVVEDLSPQLGGPLDAQDADIDNVKTLTFAEVDNGNQGGTWTLDWTMGQKQKVTLTGDVTALTLTAPLGAANLLLRIVQDGTGSRTITWPSSVKWAGGTPPTLTAAGASIDIVSFYFDGAEYYGVASLAFA